MLLLFETPAGYALFRVKKEKTLEKIDDFGPYMDNENIKKQVELQAFREFKGTKDVLQATISMVNGKMGKSQRKFLKKNVLSQEIQERLVVADKNLAKTITKKFDIECIKNDKMDELMRCIRNNMETLIEGFSVEDMRAMSLGLAHGMARYKLKFSSDKVDTMIIQAISLFQDLDKEINNYMMRLKEWYGYHFPELGKIVTDNQIYAKVVRKTGMRDKYVSTDLADIVPEHVEKNIKEAVEISMGTDINERDEEFIWALCDQVIELDNYRTSLGEYLKNRIKAVSPNLSCIVGEMISAKLIAKAGSLINLAKFPASTIQILGAEKALFKAMKSKQNTPKYGIIYQCKLISSITGKTKGKISRALAAKCALCVRYDALGESDEPVIGEECKQYIEDRIAFLTAQEKDGGAAGFKKNQKGADHKLEGGGYNAGADFKGDNMLGKRDKDASDDGEGKKKKKVKAF